MAPVVSALLVSISTHLRMQSELLPSAWPVLLPSKDQSGYSLGLSPRGSWITFVLLRISLKTSPCRQPSCSAD